MGRSQPYLNMSYNANISDFGCLQAVKTMNSFETKMVEIVVVFVGQCRDPHLSILLFNVRDHAKI